MEHCEGVRPACVHFVFVCGCTTKFEVDWLWRRVDHSMGPVLKKL